MTIGVRDGIRLIFGVVIGSIIILALGFIGCIALMAWKEQ